MHWDRLMEWVDARPDESWVVDVRRYIGGTVRVSLCGNTGHDPTADADSLNEACRVMLGLLGA